MKLVSLLMYKKFSKCILKCEASWRKVVVTYDSIGENNTHQRNNGNPENDNTGNTIFVHSEWIEVDAKHKTNYGK